MIDDITIAAKVDDLEDVTARMARQNTPVDRPETFGVPLDRGTVYVTYRPSTRIITVRISVPKRKHGHPVNFPLVRIRSVEDLDPDDISMSVARALGLPASTPAQAGDLLPLRQWAVIRVSFAADLQVFDPIASVRGLSGVRRRNAGKRDLKGDPWSTIQWSSKSLRSKFYVKDLEIRSHLKKNGAASEQIEELAEEAADALRFEVSYLQARALRRFCRIEGHLPTFAFMCDPRLDRWALTIEARRLRLLDEHKDNECESFSMLARKVGLTLQSAQREMARGDFTLSRRKTMTPKRLWDLGATFFFLSGFNGAEAAQLSGKAQKTLAALGADLRTLKIPPDSTTTASAGATIREIAAQLRPYVLLGDKCPPSLSDWNAPGRIPYVAVPWVKEHVADEASGVLERPLLDHPAESEALELDVDAVLETL